MTRHPPEGAPVFPGPRLSAAPPAGEWYFPTAVGAGWVYATPVGDIELVVTRAEHGGGAAVVTVARESGEASAPVWRYLVSRDGVFRLSTLLGPQSLPACLLRLPHRDGQRWAVPGGAARTAHGPEEVTVPAGTFRAVRVELASADGARATSWYAPGVGEVRRVSAAGADRELKAFTPGHQ